MTTGLNIETPDPKPADIDPHAPTSAAEDDDPIVAEKNAKGEDVTSVANVIHWRKEAKAAKREAAETKAQLQQVSSRLDALNPLLERIQQDPTILTRAAGHPDPKPVERDIEAEQTAEDLGLIAQDGSLDVGRARRILDRLDQRAGRTVDTRIAPLAQTTAQQASDLHRARALNMRTPDGAPFATQESINEAWAVLPAELTANPNVSAVVMPLVAAGIDRAKGRVPKAPERHEYGDPIFTEPGGRRGPVSVLTDEDRKMVNTYAPKVGEKELERMITDLAANGRRGVRLE